MEHLDGNAIAGLLVEVFGREMTSATTVCGSCRAVRLLAELHVYFRAPGTVVRCPDCGAALMRIVEARDRTWFDMSGLQTMLSAHA